MQQYVRQNFLCIFAQFGSIKRIVITYSYQSKSRDAARLSDELMKIFIREDALFEGCKSDAVILIMDRSEDPVSPLLNQWTYEAMVHELIGISNNRVIMENVPSDGQKNIVLNAQHDEFYSKVRLRFFCIFCINNCM